MIYRLVTHTFSFFHLHHFKTLLTCHEVGLHLLSGRTGTVRGLSVMIKRCGVIWCKVLGEFGLVPFISLEKVNGAWCEAQLCSEPFLWLYQAEFPSFTEEDFTFCFSFQTVSMSHDGWSWDCRGGHILDRCHHHNFNCSTYGGRASGHRIIRNQLPCRVHPHSAVSLWATNSRKSTTQH